MGYSLVSASPSLETMVNLRRFLTSCEMCTVPLISASVASRLGLRASNSSSTRGRPWVMSSPVATPPVWKVRMVQLRAGLADGLRGDDAHGLADVDQLAVGHVGAVAARAHAGGRLAGQHAAHGDFLDSGRADAVGDVVVDQLVDVDDDLAGRGIDHVLGGHAAADAVVEGLDDVVAVADVADLEAAHLLAMGGEAVHFADDVLLRHVHQAAGHVARVGGTQGGIGQRLAGAVRGEEELQDRQALAEVGADGQFDDLARRRSHQAAHCRPAGGSG